MAADQVMTVEIEGYLHHPRHLGSEDMYSEQDVSSADLAGQQRGVGLVRQGNFALTGLQSAPADPADLVHQFNPSGRYAYSRRTDNTGALSSVTKITRVPLQDGIHHLIGADATLLVTVKW